MTGTRTRSGRRPVELTASAADGMDAVKRFNCPPPPAACRKTSAGLGTTQVLTVPVEDLVSRCEDQLLPSPHWEGNSFTNSSYTEETQESRQESARLVEDCRMEAIDTPAQKKAGVARKSSRMAGLKTGTNGAA